MFWLSIVVLILVVSLLVLATTQIGITRATTRGAAAQATFDAQRAEIESNLSAGQITDDQARAMTTEAKRAKERAARADNGESLNPTERWVVPSVLAATAGAALLGYLYVGIPELPDMGLAAREAVERPPYETALAYVQENELAPPLAPLDDETAALKEQLLSALDAAPDDPRGYQFLARILYTEQDFAGAAQAQQRVIELRPEDELSALDYSFLAESMILATNQYVSPEAEDHLRSALTLDKSDAVALFYTGIALRQSDQVLRARQLFEQMLEFDLGGDAMQAQIQEQLAELQTQAGPTADDIANAANLTDEERAEMIGGMVAQLEGRMAKEGGSPADWARLINAHRVLGNTEKADAILGEALNKFPDAPELAQFK